MMCSYRDWSFGVLVWRVRAYECVWGVGFVCTCLYVNDFTYIICVHISIRVCIRACVRVLLIWIQ